MLPSYPDCNRRAAAKQWRSEIEAAGYTIRQLDPSAAAAIGTAVHAAAAHALQHKIDTGALGGVDAGLEMAMESFRAEVETGAIWDETTPNRAVAEKQIARLTRTYMANVAPRIDPLAVEMAYKADAGHGFELSGHVDVITRDGKIRDLKTGALERPYQAQLGGYSLLARSQGAPLKITGICIDFIRRTPQSKPQAEPVTTFYDRAVSERAAHHIIGFIKRDLDEFRARFAAGKAHPEEAFAANPLSMMCSSTYCPAWGTDWCHLGKKE